jgi:hypothetical protein
MISMQHCRDSGKGGAESSSPWVEVGLTTCDQGLELINMLNINIKRQTNYHYDNIVE